MDLLYYPDPRLKEIARPVDRINDGLRETARKMFEIMYQTRGIGLAAPQIGLGIRLVVANMACDPEEADLEEVYINPEILVRKDETVEEEACLSLPGLVANLSRAKFIKVRYKTLDGKTVTRTAEDLQAVLFQHEIDHLDGLLILDRMQPAERAKYRALLKSLESDFKANRKPNPAEAPAGL